MALEIDRSHPELLKVRFVIDGAAPEGPVSVVGSFNDWVPGLDELVSDAKGTRSVTTSRGSVLRAVTPASSVTEDSFPA